MTDFLSSPNQVGIVVLIFLGLIGIILGVIITDKEEKELYESHLVNNQFAEVKK